MAGTTKSKIIPFPKWITVIIFSLAFLLGFTAIGVVYSFFQNDLVGLIDYFLGKAKVTYKFMMQSIVWTIGGGILLLYLVNNLEKIKIALYGLIIGLVVRLVALQLEYPVPDLASVLDSIIQPIASALGV